MSGSFVLGDADRRPDRNSRPDVEYSDPPAPPERDRAMNVDHFNVVVQAVVAALLTAAIAVPCWSVDILRSAAIFLTSISILVAATVGAYAWCVR